VAMDGFSKIPGFIAPTVRERLAREESINSVAMLPALFLAFLQRWHAGALPYTYQDQGMDPAAAHAICEAVDPVAAICADASLWGTAAGDARLVDAVRRASQRVAGFVEEASNGSPNLGRSSP
jgi:D-arabinitol 4-dehydrogenase